MVVCRTHDPPALKKCNHKRAKGSAENVVECGFVFCHRCLARKFPQFLEEQKEPTTTTTGSRRKETEKEKEWKCPACT